MSIQEIIDKYFEYLNGGKFAELFSLFSEDAELSSPVDFRAKGLNEIKAFYLKVPENYPEHVDTATDLLIQKNKAAVLIQFEGKSAAGVRASFQAVDWFTFEEGRIKSLVSLYDSLSLSRSLKQQRPEPEKCKSSS